MGGVPYISEGTHCLNGSCYMVFNVEVVTEAEQNEGSKIFEVVAKSDKSVIHRNGLRFLKLII